LSHHAKRQYKRGVAVYVLACILAISLVANTGQVLLAQRNDERKTWKPTSKLYCKASPREFRVTLLLTLDKHLRTTPFSTN